MVSSTSIRMTQATSSDPYRRRNGCSPFPPNHNYVDHSHGQVTQFIAKYSQPFGLLCQQQLEILFRTGISYRPCHHWNLARLPGVSILLKNGEPSRGMICPQEQPGTWWYHWASWLGIWRMFQSPIQKHGYTGRLKSACGRQNKRKRLDDLWTPSCCTHWRIQTASKCAHADVALKFPSRLQERAGIKNHRISGTNTRA